MNTKVFNRPLQAMLYHELLKTDFYLSGCSDTD